MTIGGLLPGQLTNRHRHTYETVLLCNRRKRMDRNRRRTCGMGSRRRGFISHHGLGTDTKIRVIQNLQNILLVKMLRNCKILA